MKANRGIHHILSLVVKLYRRLLQKRNRTLLPWTEFRPFTELINIHPYVGVPPGLNNALRTTIGEDTGGFSTDIVDKFMVITGWRWNILASQVKNYYK